MILICRLKIIKKFSPSYLESSTDEINTFSKLLYAPCFENVAKEGSNSQARSVVTKSLAELPNTVFLLLSIYSYSCLCILFVVYVFLDSATLTEVFPCFFLGCKANARV